MGLNTIGLGLQKTNGQKNKAERTIERFVQEWLKVTAIKIAAYSCFRSGLLCSNIPAIEGRWVLYLIF